MSGYIVAIAKAQQHARTDHGWTLECDPQRGNFWRDTKTGEVYGYWPNAVEAARHLCPDTEAFVLAAEAL